ncbi:hypothetical protein WOLCODRAFT_154920 [Wolfiporia cocos MD-104 SS10]|uniref:DUF6532 domain-containing protein n=1 Tax=Wolfiporia cocos (strain MD-104) TaxID=742152 RepID=A0A2H3JRW3_WOLCO|nr:hypothetical protein WOLCODRAFT_154920 [Wolfiporia cocos MD-104 SS10]
MWFANCKDEGVVYHQFFDPIPIVLIALCFTVIENCIDEYATGVKEDIPFTATTYKGVFEQHYRCLDDLRKYTERREVDMLQKLQAKLHTTARFHSGATQLSDVNVSVISKDAFDAAIAEYYDESEIEQE